MRGTGGGKNTKEEAKAKARARTKAEEKERKVRNDSMKWRTQAVNKKGYVQQRYGDQNAWYENGSPGEGPSGMKASWTCMTRTVHPRRHPSG